MADGYNEARAMRIAEVMADFRNLQHFLAQISVSPTPEEYYLEGYTVLRNCVAEGQGVLQAPYQPQPSPAGNAEAEKAQLRAVLLDACIRRFKCQRAYLRAGSALRWVQGRQALLQGQRPTSAHVAQLQQLDANLRQELLAITNEYIDYTLRAQDAAQGKWLDEDPTLGTMLQHAR